MSTVFDAFHKTVALFPDNVMICTAEDGKRRDISFKQMAARVEVVRQAYASAGFGHGSRVAVMLPTQKAFVEHYLALNSLGCVVIPINPENKYSDLFFLIDHCQAELWLTTKEYVKEIASAAQATETACCVLDLDAFPVGLNVAAHTPDVPPGESSICSILYTSGTTGQPKGCVLSNYCHLVAGARYRDMGGVLTMREGQERFYNPTPFHHVNNLVVTLTCIILTANCLILVDRFSPKSWWQDIVASRATIMHYVGVIPSLLMNLPADPADREHGIRFGFGAGIEPQLHRRFEERFGIPLVEIWGMTETPRVFGDNFEPRRIDTRAFGRPTTDYLAKIVDENGMQQPYGTAGELLVRTAGDDPRKGFFSGYLNDSSATEASWHDGWFRTGDIVVQEEDGMMYFVDRMKNIIRRAGENISAAEVESILTTHERVSQVAVIAVKDELRDEEVMACIIVNGDHGNANLASDIANWMLERSSYFKCPGWITFLDSLPVTPSQRLQRTRIFSPDVDPRTLPGVYDVRSLKKRQIACKV